MHRLERLSNALKTDLWIKRDDLTGFGFGGNKGRKIEFLLAEAIDSKATAIVCQGAIQSNFVRQLGAACSMFGLRCVAAVMNMPYYAAAGKPTGTKHVGGGNRILDDLFGVELRIFPDGDWEQLAKHAGEVALELTLQGESPYLIAIGGSSALGAYSFHLAGEEVIATGEQFDFLVTPSSSGSTHAGLAYCFQGTKTKVIGISADPDPDDELAHDIVSLCDLVGGITGIEKKIRRADIDLRMGYCGEAYGIPSEAGTKAIEQFAKREGIILDPVYSGKAAAGLFALIESGEIGGKILFWHTGGSPTLFTTPQ